MKKVFTARPKIIGIIGPIRAGKDTAAAYLGKKLHITAYQLSGVLKLMCAEQGIEPTRANLVALGSLLGKERGDGYLAERFLAELVPGSAAIVTGMRQLGQIKIFREKSDFTLIAIIAAPEIRFSGRTYAGLGSVMRGRR